MVLRFKSLDILFHFIQILHFLIGGNIRFQKFDLMFQVMIFLIDQSNTLLGHLIIGILCIHSLPKHLNLQFILNILQLHMIGIQHNNPSQGYKRPDQKNFRQDTAAEGCILKYITDITEEKKGYCDQGCMCQFFFPDVQPEVALFVSLLEEIYDRHRTAMYCQQENSAKKDCISRRDFLTEIDFQLPFQGRCKFSENE